MLVFIGGGIGSMGRFLLSGAVQRVAASDAVFPWGTFVVNLVGCAVIGALWALSSRMPFSWSFFVFIGLLGGFTTFSSFGLDTIMLLKNNAWQLALLYVASTNFFGVALSAAGFFTVSSLVK